MKFKNLENGTVIDIADKDRIAKFQGYPDLFEEIKETKVTKETKTRKKD